METATLESFDKLVSSEKLPHAASHTSDTRQHKTTGKDSAGGNVHLKSPFFVPLLHPRKYFCSTVSHIHAFGIGSAVASAVVINTSFSFLRVLL